MNNDNKLLLVSKIQITEAKFMSMDGLPCPPPPSFPSASVVSLHWASLCFSPFIGPVPALVAPFTEPAPAFLPSLSQPLLLSLPSLLQVDFTTQVPEGGLWLVLTRLVVPLGLLNQTLCSQLQEQVTILPRPRDQVSDGHTTLFLEQEKEAWNTDHILIAFLWLKSNAAGGNWSF